MSNNHIKISSKYPIKDSLKHPEGSYHKSQNQFIFLFNFLFKAIFIIIFLLLKDHLDYALSRYFYFFFRVQIYWPKQLLGNNDHFFCVHYSLIGGIWNCWAIHANSMLRYFSFFSKKIKFHCYSLENLHSIRFYSILCISIF